MKILYALFAIVSLTLLSGCSHSTAPVAGVYAVSEIQGEAIDTARPIIVTYEEGRLFGNGPVNRWNVPVLADGKLGVGISTRMAGAPELMALETTLLQSLDGGTLEAGSTGGLTIVKDGKAVVTLQPAKGGAATE